MDNNELDENGVPISWATKEDRTRKAEQKLARDIAAQELGMLANLLSAPGWKVVKEKYLQIHDAYLAKAVMEKDPHMEGKFLGMAMAFKEAANYPELQGKMLQQQLMDQT